MIADERACSSVRLERTPDKREVDGSTPSRPTTLKPAEMPTGSMRDGGVAQLGERLPCTQEVIGSNPFTSTTDFVSGEDTCSGFFWWWYHS